MNISQAQKKHFYMNQKPRKSLPIIQAHDSIDVQDPEKQKNDFNTPVKNTISKSPCRKFFINKFTCNLDCQTVKRPLKYIKPQFSPIPSQLIDKQFYCKNRDVCIVKSNDRCFNYIKTQHIRLNRARILDWLLQICSIFNLSWRSFWGARELLDLLIIDLGFINKSNIHLYGSVSIWMSSKYHQTSPLSLDTLFNKIVFKKFTKVQLLQIQAQLLKTITFSHRNKLKYSSGLCQSTIYDRVFQIQPQITQYYALKTMNQLVYVFMDCKMALKSQTYLFQSQNQLIKNVIKSVYKGEVFENRQNVRKFYLQEYHCNNVENLGKRLKL